MRSSATSQGADALASQYNDLRKDAYGGSLLLVHEQSSPNMTVYIEPGVCYVGVTRVIYAGGNSPSITNPVTNPRIDLITIDSAGTIGVTAGTENASPSAPAYPGDKLVLAEVYLRTTGTTIRDTDQGSGHYIKNDVRPFLGGAYIATDAQVDSAAAISFAKLNYTGITVVMNPNVDNTTDFGTSSKRWKDGYFVTLHGDASQLTGLAPIQLTNGSLLAGEAIAQNDALYTTQDSGSGAYYNAQVWEGNSSGFSQSFDVGSGSNRILIVSVQNTGGTKPGSISLQYGGVSMTALTSLNYSGTAWQQVFILVAPTTGSNTLALTYTGGASVDVMAWAGSGFVQSTSVDATHTATGSGTTFSGSITTVTNGAWIISLSGNTSGGSLTSGTNATKRAGFGRDGVCDSNAAIIPAGATTTSATCSASVSWGWVQIALAPVTTPAYRVFKTSASSGTTCNGFLGFAKSAASQGQAVTIITAGVVNTFSGLTPGSQYYLSNTSGAIATSAGSTTRKAGIAISATELIVTNVW